MPISVKPRILLLLALLPACPALPVQEPSRKKTNRNVRFGMPSPAKADTE
jgi:hypothetical protein